MNIDTLNNFFNNIKEALLPPHEYVKQFTTYDEYMDFLDSGTPIELVKLKSLFELDDELPEDYLTILNIHINNL